MSDVVVSLFSGAGGCSLGFSQAGLRPMIAADNDYDATVTYSNNLNIDCALADLSTDDAFREVVRRVGRRKVAFILGGPPCQGFSTAGPRRGDDPRNSLIFNYLALVDKLAPRWFMFENVEGILTSNGGRDIVALVSALGRLGYVIRLEKVNFAAYGLPQTRKRVLIVGNKLGVAFDLPEEEFAYDSGKSKSLSKKPRAPTLSDAIADLPEAGTTESFQRYPSDAQNSAYSRSLRSAEGGVWHQFAPVSKEVGRIAPHLREGQTMKHLPEELQHESYKRRANRRVRDGTPTERRGGAPSGIKRLCGNLNALTITSAATREFLHPVEDRNLTLRECARLQAFPDDFRFSGNTTSAIRQIGNAIPPLAARKIAETLLQFDASAGAVCGPALQTAAPGLLSFRLTEASGMSPALAVTASALSALKSAQELPLFKAVANG